VAIDSQEIEAGYPDAAAGLGGSGGPIRTGTLGRRWKRITPSKDFFDQRGFFLPARGAEQFRTPVPAFRHATRTPREVRGTYPRRKTCRKVSFFPTNDSENRAAVGLRPRVESRSRFPSASDTTIAAVIAITPGGAAPWAGLPPRGHVDLAVVQAAKTFPLAAGNRKRRLDNS